MAPWYALGVLVAMPLALSAGMWLSRHQPFGWSYSVTRTVHTVSMSRHDAMSFKRVFVYAGGSGRFFHQRPEHVFVYGLDEAKAGKTSWTSPGMLIRTQNLKVEWLDATTGRMVEAPLDTARIEHFLTEFDSQLRGPARTDAAKEVERHVRELAAGQFQQVGEIPANPDNHISYSLSELVELIVVLLTFAVLSVGFVIVVRVARRRRDIERRSRWSEESLRCGLMPPPSG